MDDSTSPRVLDSLALAYFLSGEPGKAAGAVRRALGFVGVDDTALRTELERKLERYTRAAEEAGVEIEDA